MFFSTMQRMGVVRTNEIRVDGRPFDFELRNIWDHPPELRTFVEHKAVLTDASWANAVGTK